MFNDIYNSCLNNSTKNTSCNKNRKSLSVINSVLINETVVASNSLIPFDTTRIYITDDIVKLDNKNFKICTSGIYKVSFSTNARLYIGERNENIALAICINGNVIPGAITKKRCGPNEVVNLHTQVVFAVASGTTANVAILNLKDDTPTIVCDNANIIIEKIG